MSKAPRTPAEEKFLKLLEAHFKEDGILSKPEQEMIRKMGEFLDKSGELSVPEIGIAVEAIKDKMRETSKGTERSAINNLNLEVITYLADQAGLKPEIPFRTEKDIKGHGR